MHETIIANKIIAQAKKLGVTNKLHLEVGELAELEPEEVKDAVERITQWHININVQKSAVSCQCTYTGPAEIIERGQGFCYFRCPQCNQRPSILQGGEIRIIDFE